ncbi:ACBP-domain-containing protein [Cystobasidium minutum MCA 4210]|uniref:ACBP-domain-containing protein n=1 Tax=Cystobasidium minutum MCA 4210 TaxID=1397322 RepID=UPI0034CD624D|eukprot:jgi/Rhomi1/52098/CE52097_1012
MATSSGSSRQPLAPELASRVSRGGKEAAVTTGTSQQPRQRHSRRAHKQAQPHRRHQSRRSQEQLQEESHEEGDNDDNDNDIDEDTGLSRGEAALIDARFHRAVDIIQSLPKSGPITTTYEEKLMLYSLYKQATEGPVKVPRPNLLDLLGRAKWDAWKKRESLNKPQAQQAYVETLLGILKGFSDKPEAVQLINELRNFGSSDADEQTDDFESITSSQRSMSPPSTSRRTFHSAVPSNVEQSSLQGDVTPKRRPARQSYDRPTERTTTMYPETEEEEETLSDRSSDDDERHHESRPVYARQYEPRQGSMGLPSLSSSSSRPSPYHHPAQYPAPVSAQLPPHLPPADPRRQQATGYASLPPQRPLNTLRYGTAASAVPSLSTFPPDANIDVHSVHSRQSSGFNHPASSANAPLFPQAGASAGPSASLPTLPSQTTNPAASNVSTARQANLDRALDSIQTSLAAMHERLTQIEHAQMEQNNHQLRSSSTSGLLSNSPVFQLLKLMFNKLLSFLRLKRPSSTSTSTSLGTLLSRALVSILMSIRDLSRDAVALVFLAAAIAALRNARGDWRAVIRSWTRIMAMASGIGWAREGLMLGGGQ